MAARASSGGRADAGRKAPHPPMVTRLGTHVVVALLALAACAEPPSIATMDRPLLFAYGSWEGHASVEAGCLRVDSPDARGGGGTNIEPLDLSGLGDRLLALRLRVLPGNEAREAQALLGDAHGNLARWMFALPEPGAEYVTVLPSSGATLSSPDAMAEGKSLDLAQVVQWQLGGDWSGSPMRIEVSAILLLGEADDPRVGALGEERARRAEAARLERERRLAEARAGVRHTEQSPWVESLYTVAPDVLAVAIRAREVHPGKLEPYAPQVGDELRDQGHRADLLRDGQVVGKLIGKARDTLVFPETITGDKLLEPLADLPETWALRSEDDPRYATARNPLRVGRKSKPVDWRHTGWVEDLAMRHIVYLALPEPLREGAHYVLECAAINLRETERAFAWTPRTMWSEAVHAMQIGFRPDDPGKRGFLSVWLGSGGVQRYPDGLGFAVLDDVTGAEAYRGTLAMSRAADQPEDMWVKEPRNWNGTDVLRADFAELTRPGVYRLYVDGVGCGYPFRIADDVWERAFRVQMLGFLNQRSGIALGPPYTDYVKPRDMHPDDGAVVLQSRYSILDPAGSLAEMATEEPVPEGWGGYHDAGDWNPRRMTHMRDNTDLLLELYDIAPEYFGGLTWPLPPDTELPSMLREVCFEVDCFRRLQLPSGACRFGLETAADPLDGEVSWKQTMDIYAYAPDPWSGFLYTSIAARLARILERYGASLAAVYRESALRAMEWSEAEWAHVRSRPEIAARWEIPDDRNLAALELYRLTHDRRWHEVFLEDSVLTAERPELFAWGVHVQQHAAFAYASLPDDLGDPELRRKAREATLTVAERALAYAEGNAWSLTTSDKGRPLFQFFYSVPQAVSLVRAHALTGDERYLAGLVRACLFPGGANPANTTFTVGVGSVWPRNPLKVDARITGQPTPLGQTVYGPLDFLNWQGDFHTWPMRQLLSQVNTPDPWEWPVPEAFYDIWIYVAQDEYTVEGFGQNAYIWGYLAARK